MTRITTLSRTALLAAITFACTSACGSGQISEQAPFPEYITLPAGAGAAAPIAYESASAPTIFSGDQLDQLLGPIALYPDPLLAEMLPACTYPQDVTDAAQWLGNNPAPTQEAIDAQSWDPTVKAMAHYPTVLQYMADNLDWTQAVGAAFINQPQDVMDSIQGLRVLAQNDQNLQSSEEAQVVQEDGILRIEPANPQFIYVPVYDPVLVYTQPCPITWGPAFPLGAWCDNDVDWAGFYIITGDGWHDHGQHANHRDHRPQKTGHAPGTVPPRRWTRNPAKTPPKVTTTTVRQLGLHHPNALGGHGNTPDRSTSAGRGNAAAPGNTAGRPIPFPDANRPGNLPGNARAPSGSAALPHASTSENAAPHSRNGNLDRPDARPAATLVVPAPAPATTVQTPRPAPRVPVPHINVPAPRPEIPQASAPTPPSAPAHVFHESPPAPRQSAPEAADRPHVSAPHFDAPTPAPAPRVTFTPPAEPAPSAPSRGGSGFDNRDLPPSMQVTEPSAGRGHR